MTPTPIQRAVAEHFNLLMPDLLRPMYRDQGIILARHIAWYFERQAGATVTACGRIYGVDHSTVTAATNHVRARLEAGDERYTKAVAAINAKLMGTDVVAVGSCAGCVALTKRVEELEARLPFVLAPSPCGDTLKHLDLVALKGGKP